VSEIPENFRNLVEVDADGRLPDASKRNLAENLRIARALWDSHDIADRALIVIGASMERSQVVFQLVLSPVTIDIVVSEP
jgi:hypothetical protein